MELIPVLDLLGGTVVHAQRGERSRYLPLRSSLCRGSVPDTVAAALLDLHPFPALYIADLDAIGRRGDHAATIARLSRRFPHVNLWVDAGTATSDAALAVLEQGAGTVVVGTETLSSVETLATIRAVLPAERVALSLDLRNGQFLGPAILETAGALWPERVILMTLARVGSGDGPDLDRLRQTLSATQPHPRRLYAAGGVGSTADLHRLAAAGAAGVLLATALHDGRIGAADMASLPASPPTNRPPAGGP